jgi:hypothetical protein
MQSLLVNTSGLACCPAKFGLWHATRSVDRRPLEIPMCIAARGTRQLPRPSLVARVVVLVCWLCPVSLCSGVVSSFRGDSAPLLRAPGSAFHSFAFVFAGALLDTPLTMYPRFRASRTCLYIGTYRNEEASLRSTRVRTAWSRLHMQCALGSWLIGSEEGHCGHGLRLVVGLWWPHPRPMRLAMLARCAENEPGCSARSE